MTRSCLTAPARYLAEGPLLLVQDPHVGHDEPARWIASWIAFHTALLLLWNTTVIQRPGFRTRSSA